MTMRHGTRETYGKCSVSRHVLFAWQVTIAHIYVQVVHEKSITLLLRHMKILCLSLLSTNLH